DGQTNRTVDLSGIDTDNQTIDVFSLSGSTLSLSLEDDAEATKTVDLSTLSLSVKEISDADNDTKIQVEESADEDKIRIDIAGTERWIFNADRLEPVNALHNILIGENTGTAITTGYSNVLLGENAGEDITTGNGNTYIGQNVGSNTTTGDWNTAIGINSMNSNTTGTQNTAIGNKSLFDNTTGTHNTAIGRYALRANTTGLYNTSLGMDALGGNTEGESNLGLGFQAGYSNTDGDGNVYIGYQAGYNASGDKKLYIDYGPSTSPLIYGEFANNILEINGVLRPGANNTHSLGSSTKRWTAVHATNGTIQTSDVRFKKNIENMSYGLDDLMKIRSVSYEWKEDSTGNTKLGFIAQELEQIVPEVVTVANDSMQTRGVNYAELVPVLVKAIQEQQAEIEAYKLKVEQAELKNAEMTKKFESYEEELATIKSYLIGIVKED
ncbi:MAG: tail fiber domain-containing protein, partial [Bacteroidia bacterium]